MATFFKVHKDSRTKFSVAVNTGEIVAGSFMVVKEISRELPGVMATFFTVHHDSRTMFSVAACNRGNTSGPFYGSETRVCSSILQVLFRLSIVH